METNNNANTITNFLNHVKGLQKFQNINVLNLLKKSATKRYEYFNTLDLEELDLTEANKYILQRENLIYRNDDNNYIATLKLLILIQYNSTLDTFLNDLNQQLFTELYKKNGQKLSWDEKTIILTLLGLMACDKTSAFKFENNKNAEVFQACSKEALLFLQENNIVDNQYSIEKLFNSNVRGEHKVQAKMARINDIGIKTNNIYCKDPRSGHYLNIIIDNNVDINNFYFILKLIFNVLPNKQKLKELLNKMYIRRYEVLNGDSKPSLALKQKLYDAIMLWTIN